jgi:hypothetical protein
MAALDVCAQLSNRPNAMEWINPDPPRWDGLTQKPSGGVAENFKTRFVVGFVGVFAGFPESCGDEFTTSGMEVASNSIMIVFFIYELFQSP